MVVLKGLTGLKHRRLHYLENDLHGRRKWVFRLYSAQKCFARGMVIGDRKKPSTKNKYIFIFFCRLFSIVHFFPRTVSKQAATKIFQIIHTLRVGSLLTESLISKE